MGVAKKCLRGVWPNFVNLPFICNTNPLLTYTHEKTSIISVKDKKKK